MQPVLSSFAERALSEIVLVDALPAEMTVLRVCAVAEVYVDELLERLAETFLPEGTPFQRQAAQIVRAQMHQNWHQRRKWLDESFGISVNEESVTQDFDLVVELRNAIAHGGGRLTFVQKKSVQAQLALEGKLTKRLAVFCNGDRVRCSERTGPAAVRAVSRYVRELDAKSALKLF